VQHEEREMRKDVDNSKVQQAMQKLAADQAQRQEAQRQREKELAAVKARAGLAGFAYLAMSAWHAPRAAIVVYRRGLACAFSGTR
jgi:predicted DNA binding CopG/RHH family protein